MQTDPAWISYINALSTTVVAALAFVEIWGRRKERLRRSRAARHRIDVNKATLHRTLERWSNQVPYDESRLTEGVVPFEAGDLLVWVRDIQPEFPAVEELLLRLVNDSAEASDEDAKRVQEVVVLVRQGMSLGRSCQFAPSLEIGGQRADQVRELFFHAATKTIRGTIRIRGRQ